MKWFKHSIPAKLKSQVALRDKGICKICGKQGNLKETGFGWKAYDKSLKECYNEAMEHYRPVPFDTDHIIPESKGGETILENLRLTCRFCNRSKGDKYAPEKCNLDKTLSVPT